MDISPRVKLFPFLDIAVYLDWGYLRTCSSIYLFNTLIYPYTHTHTKLFTKMTCACVYVYNTIIHTQSYANMTNK